MTRSQSLIITIVGALYFGAVMTINHFPWWLNWVMCFIWGFFCAQLASKTKPK